MRHTKRFRSKGWRTVGRHVKLHFHVPQFAPTGQIKHHGIECFFTTTVVRILGYHLTGNGAAICSCSRAALLL